MTLTRIETGLLTGVILLAGVLVLGSARPSAADPTTGGPVVPYYGAAYGPPGGFAAADARRVVELLESIDRRLAAIEAAGPAPQRAARPDPVKVAAARCAACHTPAKAEAAGGGFILFADDKATALKPLSTRERSRVKEAVQSGAMPPAGKLTPAERSAFE